MQYDFNVINDKLVCDKRKTPLTGNVNTYRCVFQIESNIENLYWFCVFEREGNAYVQPILNGECFIPKEVLLSEGGIKIGCYGTNLKEDDYKRVSTNWVYFNSLEGAYSEASVPEVPEPDLWEELVLKSVPMIGENGNWFVYDMSHGKYVDTGVSAEGKDGYTPKKGVDYWTEADRAELQQYVDSAIFNERQFYFDRFYTKQEINAMLADYYTKNEVDGMVGDIESALDELHTYAQSLVSGGVS